CGSDLLVERDAMDLCKNKYNYTDNLTKEEKKALHELMNDKDIIIKPADKGGAIVIQDTDKYEAEIHSQLSDVTYYKRLPADPTLAFQSEIFQYLETALSREWVTTSEFQLLCCSNPIIPVFYTLPKIHKNIDNPPGRPIYIPILKTTTFLKISANLLVLSANTFMSTNINF
uniref:Uncharacterized protein n=1 Tax=Periophthalmus magnuspinnatus TaxID=409849 RepID=A0A3B4B7W6_9GOBI